MTRKHFEAVARAVRDIAVDEGARKELAHRLADVLSSTNPRFDRERFLKACGVAP